MALLLSVSLLSSAAAYAVPSEDGSLSTGENDVPGRTVDLSVDIVFVGFDEGVVLTGVLDSKLLDLYVPDLYVPPPSVFDLTYSVTYEYFFADPQYSQELQEFALEHASPSTTSRLNATALLHQESTGERMSIFLPQNGTAINATAVEDWLIDNPYASSSVNGYSIYVLNLSSLSTAPPDDSWRHWFEVETKDPDTAVDVDWWRLEWDNELNRPMHYPYLGWGNRSRTFFFDPSAHQWYLQWDYIWWQRGPVPPTEFHDHFFTDLRTFLLKIDLGTTTGREDLTVYLSGWLNVLLRGLLFPHWGTHRLVQNVSVQLLVLNGVQEQGFTKQDLEWVLSEEPLRTGLEDLIPVFEWQFETRVADLEEHPQLQELIANFSWVADGWTYVDGDLLWRALDERADEYFDLEAADLVVTGVSLVLRNASLTFWGTEFTGLGGENSTLTLMELSRLYEPDMETPRSGFTWIVLHEIGHVLGFNHMGYMGDFTGDVMGYYAWTAYFSQFSKDSWYRLSFDRLFEQERHNLGQTSVNQLLQLYEEMRYLDAYSKLHALAFAPRVDQAFVSDGRADVGSNQEVGFHASWRDGTPVVGGSIFINDTKHVTNSSGWISLRASFESVGRRAWFVTGVVADGVTDFTQTAEDPVVIWDAVVVRLLVQDGRLDVGSTADVMVEASYAYDGQPLSGTVTLNDTLTKSQVGRYGYRIASVIDEFYGLSAFTSNEVQVVFDKVSIEFSVEDARIDVGSNAQILIQATYVYDGASYDGKVFLTEELTQTQVGEYVYEVASIAGDRHGITVFDANSVPVVFDRVHIQLTVPTRWPVETTVPITWSGFYAFDEERFQGTVSFNQATLKDRVGTYEYTAVSIIDDLYNLAEIHTAPITVTFDRVEAAFQVETSFPGYLTVSVALTYASDASAVSGASVKIGGSDAVEDTPGLYTAVLRSLSPLFSVGVKASVPGFPEVSKSSGGLHIANTLLILLLATGIVATVFLLKRLSLAPRSVSRGYSARNQGYVHAFCGVGMGRNAR